MLKIKWKHVLPLRSTRNAKLKNINPMLAFYMYSSMQTIYMYSAVYDYFFMFSSCILTLEFYFFLVTPAAIGYKPDIDAAGSSQLLKQLSSQFRILKWAGRQNSRMMPARSSSTFTLVPHRSSSPAAVTSAEEPSSHRLQLSPGSHLNVSALSAKFGSPQT